MSPKSVSMAYSLLGRAVVFEAVVIIGEAGMFVEVDSCFSGVWREVLSSSMRLPGSLVVAT
jgi:hypothetical protein